jgi:protocatechuate 3,4-dioxygenase beta subunit
VRDSETGQPVTRAELDFWQTNEDGVYDNDGFHLRGVVRTDAQGLYRVRTVVAKDYEEHDNDPIGELFRALGRHNRRAGHIHLKVRCDRYAPLTTQLFMGDSAYLGSDYIEGAVSPDLTLLFEASNAGGHGEVNAKFDIALRPAVTVSMAGAAAGSGGTSP